MTSAGRTRVMLVNQESLMGDLLRDLLEGTGEFEVVALAVDGREAVGMVEEAHPDLVVMDLVLPVMGGIEACREILRLLPDARVAMLVASVEQDSVVGAVAAGAMGYLERGSGKEHLLEMLRGVSRGEFRIPGCAAGLLAGSLRSWSRGAVSERLDVLTERERGILRLFADGLSYQEIGEIRNTGVETVRNAVSVIQKKLGFKTRYQMLVWAVRAGVGDGRCE